MDSFRKIPWQCESSKAPIRSVLIKATMDYNRMQPPRPSASSTVSVLWQQTHEVSRARTGRMRSNLSEIARFCSILRSGTQRGDMIPKGSRHWKTAKPGNPANIGRHGKSTLLVPPNSWHRRPFLMSSSCQIPGATLCVSLL